MEPIQEARVGLIEDRIPAWELNDPLYKPGQTRDTTWAKLYSFLGA